MSRRTPWAILVAAALLSTGAMAAPIAEMNTSGAEVQFRTLVEHAGAVLTVSTPGGAVLRFESAAGAVPSFGLFDAQGQNRPDGIYSWELRLAPVVSADTNLRLRTARQRGDRAAAAEQARAGLDRELVQSGTFAIAAGSFVEAGEAERPVRNAAANSMRNVTGADQVIPDDLIVQGSGCFGFDCVNNESFGFDTIRLKENNLRIKAEDTSVGTFPTNDWQLTFNDSASGGSSKFSVEDITGARVPFTITAGASTNSIFVDSTGRIGLKTSTPVLDLHINTSNTPSIRLEQNNSGGFTAQTWDIGANEANFFVRDVTGGSRLSFRIRPGAPTSSLDISSDGDVGVGTGSPGAKLHVQSSGAGQTDTKLLVENTNTGASTARELLELQNDHGQATMVFKNGDEVERWANGTFSSSFVINNQNNAGVEYTFGNTGNFVASGTITPGSSRTIKQAFTAVSPGEILSKVLALPITSWSYKADPAVRHIGPMAEDFFAAFAVGADATGISVTDSAGVALAAIQALHQELAAKDSQIETLQQRLTALEAMVAAIAPK